MRSTHEDKSEILKYIMEYTQIDGKVVPGVFSGNKGVLRLNIYARRVLGLPILELILMPIVLLSSMQRRKLKLNLLLL